MNSTIGIGLLGCGTVGGGVADLLLNQRAQLGEWNAPPFTLRSIAVRSLAKARPAFIHPELLSRDAAAVIDDPENDLIIECIGGVSDAAVFIERALRRGKHVVTANKDLIATEGPRFYALAARAGVSLQYEASVGGAIPIVRTLSESLSSEEILEVAGVLNGTTNFILTRMHDGASYEDALGEAQRRGYAESNPSSDVSGLDAAHKLAILSQLAFRRAVTTQRIPLRGIEALDRRDIELAESLGCVVKLLGFARNTRENYAAAVTPAIVHKSHPFAAPLGADNCIRLLGRSAGSLIFSGAGAGREPTASAVLADVVAALRSVALGTQPVRGTRTLLPVTHVEFGAATLGRIVRFKSDADAYAAETLLEGQAYRTRPIHHHAALEIVPLGAARDSQILQTLDRAQIHAENILPLWSDFSHPHVRTAGTFTGQRSARRSEIVA